MFTGEFAARTAARDRQGGEVDTHLVECASLALSPERLGILPQTLPVFGIGQLLTRRNVEAVPTVADASVLEVSDEELKASILLFYSLLDEQQRRLYAGLESLKLGRGGDRSLADFLDLDPHTVARGRQQLLTQDVEVDRARKTGGGRRRVEKKLPK